MLNPFYISGFMWTITLLAYYLGWSDLCTKLDTPLLVIIIGFVVVSFFLGYKLRDKIKFCTIPYRKNIIRLLTLVLVLYFSLELLISWRVPLIEVLSGKSYSDMDMFNIPILHNVFTGFAIMFSTYLAWVFASTREKRVLPYIVAVNMIFLVLVQRQYLFISLMLAINVIYSGFIISKNKRTKIRASIIATLSIILALFGFGVLGNVRYGSSWSWNDSSMIYSGAHMNEKYPSWIPKEFSWAYVYTTSPLANLNYNIGINDVSYSTSDLMGEFIPSMLSRHLGVKRKASDVILQVPSLTASTAYAGPYLSFSYFGIILSFVIQIMISYFVIRFSKKENLVVVCSMVIYFLLMSLFENPFVFPITSMVMIMCIAWDIFLIAKKKKRLSIESKNNQKRLVIDGGLE